MCGSCEDGSCSYDRYAGNVPQTLFVQPSDFVACKYLFVKFNVKGGGKNACGSYVLGPGIPGTTKTFGTTDEYAFVISVGVGTLVGSSSCKNNANLNPEVMSKYFEALTLLLDETFISDKVLSSLPFLSVACSTSHTGPEPEPESDFLAIHISCSVELSYGDKFGPDENSVAITGACSGENQEGACGYNYDTEVITCCSTSSAAGPTPTTPRPTSKPTPHPTSEPTPSPSDKPSVQPSPSPSYEPSPSPSSGIIINCETLTVEWQHHLI